MADDSSGVVLAGDVLAADHPVSLEPLAAELLGGSLGGVRPLDGDAVVVGVLRLVAEGVAGDGDHGGLLGVQQAAGGQLCKGIINRSISKNAVLFFRSFSSGQIPLSGPN